MFGHGCLTQYPTGPGVPTPSHVTDAV
jgi:hypothetical protein